MLSPVGEVTTLSELRWKPISGIDSYEAKLYTEAGDLLWEGSGKENTAILPESVRESLIPGHIYMWQVEALSQGERLKSQLIRFRIRR